MVGELMIGELLRKSIHLSGLALPVIYLFLDKPTMLVIIGILTGLALAVELVKWLSRRFGEFFFQIFASLLRTCLLYTSPSPRDRTRSRMPSSA